MIGTMKITKEISYDQYNALVKFLWDYSGFLISQYNSDLKQARILFHNLAGLNMPSDKQIHMVLFGN